MNRVDVFLGGVHVGEIERFGDPYGDHVFRFAPAYLMHGHRPVLGQLFEDRLPRDIVTDGLPLWFEHLLPPTKSPLRRAIAASAQLDDDDGLALLAWLGEALPGSVRVTADGPNSRYRRTDPPKQLPLSPSVLRMSLAGNQWKLTLERDEHARMVVPLKGNGEFIAKFHTNEFPELARVEFATMTWAQRVGLVVPKVELIDCSRIEGLPEEVPRGDGVAFVIERFDRSSTTRIHAEDFAQILDQPDQFARSYEDIGRFIASDAPDDFAAYLERLVFMVMCGNTDAHLKNWGVIYPGTRKPRLGPCYDLVSTVVYPSLPPQLALKLSGAALSFKEITATHFLPLGRLAGLTSEVLLAQVGAFATRVRERWHEVRDLWPAPFRERLEGHLAKLKL